LQLREIDPGRVVANRHDPVRFRVGQRTEQYRVDDGEDRDIGANPQRQGEGRGSGVAAPLGEGAAGES
jgi:hypothetical protein